jgi:hypothetical protein
LSCRRVASIVGQYKPALKPGIIRTRDRFRVRGPPRHYGKENLLLDLRRWNFIPKELSLCKSCWRYLPRNRIWTTRSGLPLKALKRVDWSWMVMLWQQGGKYCPTCQLPEEFDEGVTSSGTFVQNWSEGMVAKVVVAQLLRAGNQGPRGTVKHAVRHVVAVCCQT